MTCRKRGAEPADLKALKDRDKDRGKEGRKEDKEFQKQTIAFKRTDINCFKKFEALENSAVTAMQWISMIL